MSITGPKVPPATTQESFLSSLGGGSLGGAFFGGKNSKNLQNAFLLKDLVVSFMMFFVVKPLLAKKSRSSKGELFNNMSEASPVSKRILWG